MKTRAIVYDGVDQVRLGEVTLPACGPKQVVAKTLYTFVSPGTELRVLGGHYGAAGNYPLVPGYAAISEIVEVGAEVRGFRVGDRISCRNAVRFADMNVMWGGEAGMHVYDTETEDTPVLLPQGLTDEQCLPYAAAEVAAISLRGVSAAVNLSEDGAADRVARIGAAKGLPEKALDATKRRLECEHGIVLNQPAFTRYVVAYGEISSYPPGYKENAGVFCHNNPWIIIAETLAGRGDDAFAHWAKIAPSYTEGRSELHKVEPYVYSQMIAGRDAARPGEAKNSWLTGTAAWNWYAISQFMLGVKPDYDGLVIDPCIPKTWRRFTVTRRFRGGEYVITVRNPDGVARGVEIVRMDGETLPDNRLPVRPGRHVVDVLMSSARRL